MKIMLNNDVLTFLNTRRLPARLSAEQTAALLGFSNHDIPVLAANKLLRPLGKPTPNSPKYFAAAEIEVICQNTEWLAKATKTMVEHWATKNSQRTTQKGGEGTVA